jgi:hypothetical protein
MKISYIALTFALLGILASANATEAAKPQIAIYVTGEELKPAEKRALETKFSNAFVESGRFIKAERNDVFLNSIATEIKKQSDGSVNDGQIISSGDQAGAQFVCVANFENAFGSYLLSARVLDVKAAVAVGMGEIEIKKMDNDSINNAVAVVFKKIKSQMKILPAVYIEVFNGYKGYVELLSSQIQAKCNCTIAKTKENANYTVVVEEANFRTYLGTYCWENSGNFVARLYDLKLNRSDLVLNRAPIKSYCGKIRDDKNKQDEAQKNVDKEREEFWRDMASDIANDVGFRVKKWWDE